MDITKTDVTILVTMTFAVVGMSFVMPVLGLSNPDANQSDIPELDVQSDRFEVATDRPRFPNTATSGTLAFNTTKDPAFSDNQIYLESGSSSTTLALTQNASTNDSQVTLTVFNSSGGVVDQDKVFLDTANNNTSGVLTAEDYTIAVEATEANDPPDYLEVAWDIDEQAETDSWVGRIPGVGALFSTADLIAQVLAWAVTVFIWFSTSLVFGALNLIGILVDGSIYFLSLLGWLGSTYGTVITAAPAWVGVFVSIPGILLSATLGKIVIVLFRSLPTT